MSQINYSIASNTTIHLKRGEQSPFGMYPGELEIYQNSNNVNIVAYGQGSAPVIIGSDLVNSGWTPEIGSGGIWHITTSYQPGHLYFNDEIQTLARYPDLTAADNGWLQNDQFIYNIDADDELIDAELANYPGPLTELIGATAVVRSHNWQYDKAVITGVGADKLYLTDGDIETVNMGVRNWGYFLQGKDEFLNEIGEWSYTDLGGGQFLIRFYSGDEQNQPNVRLGHRESGVRTAGALVNDQIRIRDISFKHQTSYAIALFIGTNHSVCGCSFQNAYGGIGDLSADAVNSGHIYMNNSFENLYDGAIKSNGDGVIISQNTVLNVGLHPGLGMSGFGGYQGILAGRTFGLTLKDNSLENIGYTGIAVAGTGTVEQNYVRNALAILNDGAGITFDHVNNSPSRLLVAKNIVCCLGESGENLQSTATHDGNDPFPENTLISFGIYFGNKIIKNVDVHYNTVYECSAGIHVDHSVTTSGCTIENNTLFNNTVQLSLSDYSNFTQIPDYDEYTPQGEGGPVHKASFDDNYEGNIMYSLNSDQVCMKQQHTWSDGYVTTYGLVDYGDFSNNFYFNPFNKIVIHQAVRYTIPNVTGRLSDRIIPWTLEAWQQQGTDLDLGSSSSPLNEKDHYVTELHEIVGFSSDDITPATMWRWNQIEGNNCTYVGTDIAPDYFLRVNDCSFIAPWDCFGFGLCNPVIGGAGPDDIPAETYRFSFRTRFSNASAFRVGPVFKDMYTFTHGKYVGLTTEWTTHEMIFDLSDAIGSALGSAFQNVQYGLGALSTAEIDVDQIEVRRCIVDPNYTDVIKQNHILVYNNPLAPIGGSNIGDQPYALEGCWKDVQGNLHTGSITLQTAWASKVLYKWETDFDIDQAEYPITAPNIEVWDEPLKVKGSIIVESGATLVINNTTIEFSESTPYSVTNIVVEPGGLLEVVNNAHLTSVITDCGTSAMWDGIKVLGQGNNVGAGTVKLLNGATISNALIGVQTSAKGIEVSSPYTGHSQTGGIVQGEGATFRNNVIDVLFGSQQILDNTPDSPNHFRHCHFVTDSELNDANYPRWHIVAVIASRITISSCTFQCSSGLYQSEPYKRGLGVMTMSSSVIVDRDAQSELPTVFSNLSLGLGNMWVSPQGVLQVDGAVFEGCKGGLWTLSAQVPKITNNNFAVPDMDGQSTYGVHILMTSGFEFEENIFIGEGDDTSPRSVAMAFQTCGPEANFIYNNKADGFSGSGGGNLLSAGLIISGANSNADGENGIEFKCNDFSNDVNNDVDIAFTGSMVKVKQSQGMPGFDQTSPAGNTFAQNCGWAGQHIYVENNLNPITYYHHAPASGVELVPDCHVGLPFGSSLENTFLDYQKEVACLSWVGMNLDVEDLVDITVAADNEMVYLRYLYYDWRDGGDHEGLIDFINDPMNDSYSVRNQLMQLAPTVSEEAWEAVFLREPAMYPWHIAQALVANSPLEPSVIEMMYAYELEPYYYELVENHQDGVSMHRIYKSEIAHFYAKKSKALHDATRRVIHKGEYNKIDTLLWALHYKGAEHSDRLKLSLHLTRNDLVASRSLIDLQLSNRPDGYWEIQDLYLRKMETQTDITDIDPNDLAMLVRNAEADTVGSGEAMAWLELLGYPQEFPIIFPEIRGGTKSLTDEPARSAPRFMKAYPNPSNGPVTLAFTPPEGVDHVEITVYDLSGRMIQRSAPQAADGLVTLNYPAIPGMYVAKLTFDGIPVEEAKVTITR